MRFFVGDQGDVFLGGLFLLNPIHHPGPWERTFSRARIRVLFIPRRISSPSTASLLAGLGRIPHDAVGQAGDPGADLGLARGFGGCRSAGYH